MNDIKKNFVCDICDFKCSKQSANIRHNHTAKHKRLMENIQKTQKDPKKTDIVKLCTCDCGKEYKHISSLCKHKRKCYKSIITDDNINETNKTNKTNKTDNFTPSMFMEMMKQINEENQELRKQIIELSSKPTTTNNNRKFNLNSFLNETCKDALNINDFVKNLQITEKDVDETNKIGYVNGITKIFITALEKLEINQRPVHCSDTKRESVYIRHDNKWEKENYLNIKLTYAIGHIVKLLRNTYIQRNELLEKQGIRTNLFPEPRIDVSEVTKPIGMEYTTPKESCKNYERIARNIMRETNIPK